MYKKRIISAILLLSMMILTVPVNAETVSAGQQNAESLEETFQGVILDEESVKVELHNGVYLIGYNPVLYGNMSGGSAPSSEIFETSQGTITSSFPTYNVSNHDNPVGYRFMGWSTSYKGSVTHLPGDRVTLTKGVTLILYSVYDEYTTLSTSTNKTSSEYINVGGAIAYYKFTPSVTATYVFQSTNSNGDTYGYLYDARGNQIAKDDDSGDGNNFQISYKLYSGNSYYFGTKWYSSSNTGTIYVRLSRTYNVKYNANGGTGAPSSQTKLHGDTLTLTSSKPTRTGYTFAGWDTSSTATTAKYSAGGSCSLNGDTTLYAIWKAEGACGDNCTYLLDNNGTLTINGTGNMTDYTNASSVPWSSIRGDIKKIVVSEGITSIGNNCFNLCTAATTISLPSTLTSVGESSFAYTPITSLSLQEGVTSIGNSAFEGCSKLSSIVLPSTLTQIGSSAFINCSLLNNVGIPSGVTAINDYCFAECSALKNITIPLSVTEIKDYAFCLTPVETVTYTGSPTHWNRIEIGTENSSLSSATKTYGVEDFTVTYAVTTNGAGSADKTTDQVPNGEKADLTVVAKRALLPGGGPVGSEKDVPWEFLGWNTVQNATTALDEVVVTSNVTLYPIFKKELTYNFYHANNELLESKTVTIYNSDDAAKITMPTIETYIDWEPVEWCNDKFYSEMSDPVRMFDINAEVGLRFSSDFYARYKRTTTVSYDAGDYAETFEPDTFTQYYYGSGQKTSETVFMPEILPLPIGEPIFYGWAENSVDGDVFQSGDRMTAREDTTMYALWQERAISPTISVSEVDGYKTVTMSCSMDGAAIYYTTDGTRATTESNAYTEPLTITGNEDISFKAIAVKDGYAYSKPVTKEVALNKLSAPVSNVLPGYVAANTVVKLSIPDNNGAIYYTTDGSIPTADSTPYTEPIIITEATSIRAVTIKDGTKNSDIVLFNYMLVDEDTPYISISSELNADNTAVTVKINITANSKSTGGRFNLVYDNEVLQVASSSSGAYIAGTTNYIHEAYADNIVRVVWAGTKELNDAGEIMTVTFNIIGDDKETLLYIDGAKLSDPSGAKFDVQAASTMIPLYQEIIPTTAITLDKENLNLIVGQTATLTATVSPDNATNKSVIWGSSNESVATVSDGIVTAVSAGETTITVTQTNTWVNDTCTVIVTNPVQKEKVQTPIANKESGAIQTGTKIELSSGTTNASIYYTTDGSEPNASKSKYVDGITVNEDVTIKAIAIKDGYEDSDIATFSYTVLNENAPTIFISDVKGMVGREVNVTLSVKNNPGIAVMRLDVNYDKDIMELTGVTDKGLLGAKNHSNDLTLHPYCLYWPNDTATVDYAANGDIVTLTFKIKEDAECGTYPISVSYDYDNYDIYNVALDPVLFETLSGNVIVENFTYGDVNDDGRVNALDGTLLSRYIGKWAGVTINLDAADVNNDGRVNPLDSTILKRYVGKWAGYNQLPYQN